MGISEEHLHIQFQILFIYTNLDNARCYKSLNFIHPNLYRYKLLNLYVETDKVI